MVSKEFFEFISTHCGNVVAWLLILWPFIHLILLFKSLDRKIFSEYIALINKGSEGKGVWITAIKIVFVKQYPQIQLYLALSILYFGFRIGFAVFIVGSLLTLVYTVLSSKETELSIKDAILVIAAIINSILLLYAAKQITARFALTGVLW